MKIKKNIQGNNKKGEFSIKNGLIIFTESDTGTFKVEPNIDETPKIQFLPCAPHQSSLFRPLRIVQREQHKKL